MGEVLPKETEEAAKEEDAALIEFYSSFRDLFEFFCLNTTIHGTIRLVCSGGNRMKTAFWALLFLSSFAMLYWQFALIFNQYWAYPVVMSMSVHSEPKMFPAITLCSLNPYRISPVNQDIAKLDNLARETLFNLYGFRIPKNTKEDVGIDFSEENPGQVNGSTFHLDRNIALLKMDGKVGFRLVSGTAPLPTLNCLSLILKVEQKDHIPLLSTTAGVRVMIHRHNQTPFLEHEGFDIRPGTKSTIGIKQACLHSCFQHHMVKNCGCGYYFYPLPSGAEYCNYNKHPAWGHCFYLLYKELTDHQLICFRQCPKLCKETWYKLSAGYANWPSTKSEKWIHRALQADRRHNITTMNRKDIAKVNIFYEQLDYYSWDESPEYNVTLVMSNMGSQWSLWFGSSVLSVVEMFEFLVDVTILSLIFFYRRLTAKRRHKMSRPPKVPSVSLTLEKYRYIEEGLAMDQDAEKSQASYENPSFIPDEGLPPYSKHNKYQMPELYPPVVLHRFKHQEDQGTHQDPPKS
ncbi:PREDICTED: amiloride-sensitive sodium channel subunit delta [Thamnophis sirtalis]|uniref:Amiloride-sensitive sodium channel subunit delta n=1 Tax=Thamnophis sirtalis TaxID=35019 RepID=A0A6I9XM02_9SAUR|nr:PREDICTED: amiloride-sensitive sodium channel subunit delta [Thamnophis sirtalis]